MATRQIDWSQFDGSQYKAGTERQTARQDFVKSQMGDAYKAPTPVDMSGFDGGQYKVGAARQNARKTYKIGQRLNTRLDTRMENHPNWNRDTAYDRSLERILERRGLLDSLGVPDSTGDGTGDGTGTGTEDPTLSGRDMYIPPEIWERFFIAPDGTHRDEADLAKYGHVFLQAILSDPRNAHLRGVEPGRLIDQFRRMLGRPDTAGGAIQPGEFSAYTLDSSGRVIPLDYDPNQTTQIQQRAGGGGGGGGGTLNAALSGGAGANSLMQMVMGGSGAGTNGNNVTADIVSTITGGSASGTDGSPLDEKLRQEISDLLTLGPEVNLEAISGDLKNYRERLNPAREAAVRRAMSTLQSRGVAGSDPAVAEAIAEIDTEVANSMTQEFRRLVKDEADRSQQRYLAGINAGGALVQSDRAYQLGLVNADLEAQRIRQNGVAIDGNLRLQTQGQQLAYLELLHRIGMDRANYGLAVDQFRSGNANQILAMLLQMMGILSNGTAAAN